MKKIICVVLAIGMALSLAACNSAPVELTGTLEEISDSVYANATSIEMAMGPAIEIELADADSANYYLGVTSTDSIERAVFSEPMIGSIAYSMCLVKAKADADVEALKAEILEGVNYRKWICVAAEKIAVVNCGSTIMMVMSTEEIVDDVCNAFSAVAQAAGAEIAEPLTKAGEVQEEIPKGGIADMEIPADMPAFDGETIGEEIPAEDGIVLA
ncbi:MAG: hypothetical protein IJ264_08240 [Clostridia bacterium]|nr:hypothetical protein [Clostridia bacterium]